MTKWLREFRAENAIEDTIENVIEDEVVQRLQLFLASHGANALGREIVGDGPDAGHVTGAAWILNRDSTRVLLVFGVREQAWKLPGAHCESAEHEPDLFRIARGIAQSEATRALGRLANTQADLFAVSEREISDYWNTPAHLHFEVVFRFNESETATNAAVLPRGARWFWLEEAAQLGCPEIARLARKTQHLFEENTAL